MCLIKIHRFPKLAKEDIVVYKELDIVEKNEYKTPYQHVLVKLNSYIYNTLPIWFGIFNFRKIEGEGVHSYKYPRKGLFKAIIPKGSWYYIGIIGNYASNKLYITNEQVCSVDTSFKATTKKILV